jgi:catechol 2,3-dioxygenase-like lactoylglutathione lyase family enzyme
VVIQHVGIEVAPPDLERSVEFWRLLGFTLVEPPTTLSEFTWLEREGTQIHLMPTDSPTVPPRAHVAIVAPRSRFDPDSGKDRDLDFEEVVERLRQAGFEVEPGREHWGVPRAHATAPGGHQVELMESPPPAMPA